MSIKAHAERVCSHWPTLAIREHHTRMRTTTPSTRERARSSISLEFAHRRGKFDRLLKGGYHWKKGLEKKRGSSRGGREKKKPGFGVVCELHE